jgi:hypothetical protein
MGRLYGACRPSGGDGDHRSALRHRVPMRVLDYGGFLASNPTFLVLTDGHDWLLTHLVNSGYVVNTVAHGLLAVDTTGVAAR